MGQVKSSEVEIRDGILQASYAIDFEGLDAD
jgi:hypothetical protein